MPLLILWPLVALVVIALAAVTIRHVPPALAQRRHAAALVRIDVLERDLGLAAPTDAEVDALGRKIAAAERARWAREPDARIFAYCEQCLRRVAVNVGSCDLDYGLRERCAKRLWRNQ